jgi:hypothetical protein
MQLSPQDNGAGHSTHNNSTARHDAAATEASGRMKRMRRREGVVEDERPLAAEDRMGRAEAQRLVVS